MLESLRQDLRYSLRLLRQSRGVSAVAVLTLALGIGANTAIFSILDPLLLRKVPVDHPDELALLDSAGTMGKNGIWPVLALDQFREVRAFTGALAFAPIEFEREARDGSVQNVRAEMVSGDYFSLLGVKPYAGRLIEADDDRGAFGSQVAVLSYEYWRREFKGEVSVVGKMVPIHHMTYTVVGVAPPEFSGLVVGEKPEFYLPLKAGRPMTSSDPYSSAEWVTIVARLRPGVSAAQAAAATEPLLRQIADDSGVPEVERKQAMARMVVTSAARGISSLRERFSLPARILMAVVALVLLIACANVASLLLAQGEARRQEIAVKLALGAGRLRLARQFLTQALLLAAMGAAGGLVLAQWSSGVLANCVAPAQSGPALGSGLDGRVLLFTLAATALTVLLCGLAPALSATRPATATSANQQRRHVPRRLNNAMVLGQVAVSVTLLVTAGLLLRSLVKLETFDAGFNRDRVLVAEMNDASDGWSPERVHRFYDRLLAHAKRLPGVQSASLASFSPMSGRVLGINLQVEGYNAQAGEELHAFFNQVRPRYFATLGTTLIEGRDFSPQDTVNSPLVAIINRTMARHYFGTESALGRTFKTVEGNRGPYTIIGVAADSRYNDLREVTPDLFYLSSLQAAPRAVVKATLIVRAAGASAAMLAVPVRETIRSLDRTVSINARTLREQVDDSLRQERLIAALCAAFSLLALLLTCVGLYGLLSLSVARRTSEIGIRMALGAGKSSILGMVIGGGMRLATVGLLLGALGAFAASTWVRSMLFGVGRADLVTLAVICLVLSLAALVACYLPARRATRVDPMAALRSE
ncbi:MAG TPA: ABC transporter permease [Candidatus Angelobacter sp.]